MNWSFNFLRLVLLADAISTAVFALPMIFGAGLLEQIFGLSPELTRNVGISLIPFVAFVAYVATREKLAPSWVWTVILWNALWVAGGILFLWNGWIQANPLGSAFVVIQIVGPVVFAALEYLGLRKLTMAAA